MTNPKPRRKNSLRLRGYDYSSVGAYFVTIATWQREMLFGDVVKEEMVLNDVGKIAYKWWLKIPEHFPNVKLENFIIMPNHIHGIIILTDGRGAVSAPDDGNDDQQGRETLPLHRENPTLGQIIAYFKYQSTKEMNALDGLGEITKFWQRNYHACPEPVEGTASSATKGKCPASGITSNPTPHAGTMTMKIHAIGRDIFSMIGANMKNKKRILYLLMAVVAAFTGQKLGRIIYEFDATITRGILGVISFYFMSLWFLSPQSPFVIKYKEVDFPRNVKQVILIFFITVALYLSLRAVIFAGIFLLGK